MFKKILIANRGEIACRIMTTAKKMGIGTVAVYSDVDCDALHVQLASDAVHLGPSPSSDSYLNIDRIVSACLAAGADAVHPGYGFLSENATFARRAQDAGIAFIGPSAASIEAMGDKISSKALAKSIGVPTIPGWDAAIESAEHAVDIANQIGLPVMIKATAGGGGKGLRLANSAREVSQGFTASRNEAKKSFGDDRVFIEKFIEDPRHIEIQVLGDAYGHMVHLNERECSIQRRHQKVIEESPSPFISELTRTAMGEQAIRLARAVDYQSAGTVEFVLDKDQNFYFLEMNTRLQVEHPVTECITGLDLVEWMIRIAAGEELDMVQSDVKCQGWAIECRLNAEDPYRNFLPSPGRLDRFEAGPMNLHAGQPGGRYGVRLDTGVREGSDIPIYYDSMIGKVIAYGHDRGDAISRMVAALDAFRIEGIQSNLALHQALMANRAFLCGDYTTGLVATAYPKGLLRAQDPSARAESTT